MKVLYILKHDPWGIGGGCYACRNYLEAFTEIFRDARMDVLICQEYLSHANTDEFPCCRFIAVKPRGKVSQYLTPLTGVMHRHHAVATRMIGSGNYDICIFDHNAIAGSLVEVCRKHGVKTIVINHNCEQEYFHDNNTTVKRLLLLPTVRRNERRSYRQCDCNIFLTDEDRQLFAKLYGPSPTRAIVGGCFLHKCKTLNDKVLQPFHNDRLRLVISGTIGNLQNIDGIQYFLDELYPRLPDDIDVTIAGKNPPERLAEKLRDYGNVKLVANPKDMDAILSECDLFLCTTRLGGGMKMRVMDGLRNGLPVIAHKVSARGYGDFVGDGTMMTFESSEEFSSAVSHFCKAIKNGEVTKQGILSMASKRLSFDACVERIGRCMKL